MGMADILQKVNRKMKSICPRCIHNNVCIANANQPCFECNQFMEVVRCKDCANRHSSEFCECRPEDGFCNDGIRKEN